MLKPLLTLPQAAQLLFGDERKTGGLRAEIKKGKLTPTRIGRNLFVTEADLERMIEKCRARKTDQSSPNSTENGSTGTDKTTEAQDAALTKLRKLKEN